MELRHRILAFSNSPNFEFLKLELQKLRCVYKFNENGALSSIEYTFSEHESYAARLIEFANYHQIIVQSGLFYEEEEILNAEWVIAAVGEYQYPQPEDNYKEATYDTRNYCSRCGQGAIQNRPFRLKKDFVQRQTKFLGLHWVFDEIFVRPEIKGLFDAASVSGITYLDVVQHKTGQRINDLLQVKIPVLDHPGLITDELFTVTCKSQNEESYVEGVGQIQDKPGLPFCGRVKYRYPLTKQIKFRASALKSQPDFVKSQEYLGSGAAANRFILVRNRVVRLIKDKGIRGPLFRQPVFLI
jgi:hypothetical protein